VLPFVPPSSVQWIKLQWKWEGRFALSAPLLMLVHYIQVAGKADHFCENLPKRPGLRENS
jgi:hypothetical protein